jgi:GNAT superfamily N-acetyltransferase
MIKLATKDDTNAIMSIARNVGIFEESEIRSLEEFFVSWLEGSLGESSRWITVQEDNKLIGTAYFAPEKFAQGTWNVYFIAVDSEQQRNGIGGVLMRHIEQAVVDEGARILIVETSSLPHFQKARQFYLRQGYTQEACIREFYKAGDDKIVFRKSFT